MRTLKPFPSHIITTHITTSRALAAITAQEFESPCSGTTLRLVCVFAAMDIFDLHVDDARLTPGRLSVAERRPPSCLSSSGGPSIDRGLHPRPCAIHLAHHELGDALAV